MLCELDNEMRDISQETSTPDICQFITIPVGELMFEFLSFFLKGNTLLEIKILIWFLKSNQI